jgi:hypothetical protein
MRLFLLFFGVFIAVQWVGLPADPPQRATIPYADYLPWLGLLLFTAGVHVHFSAAKGAFPWSLLVVAAAWVGSKRGASCWVGR